MKYSLCMWILLGIYGGNGGTIPLGGGFVNAQVIPDHTLPSVVNSLDGRNFTITGGGRSGSNLFHSFSQFSIPTGGSAIFNNTLDVQNIFTRVTGSTLSTIDGQLSTSGTANLFLLNPKGILFGPSASLNMGGSFVGTTANSVKFADGAEFSAVNPNGTPLLTISAPIGLHIGQNSGHLHVQGGGHHLLHPPAFINPVSRTLPPTSLSVLPGKTLALIGNGIQLEGGVLLAESGHIELGSVSSSIVELNTTTPQWQFRYPVASSVSDIHLSRAALIDVSGSPGGSVQLRGQVVRLQDSAIVLNQHQGTQAAGKIRVEADSLELSGGFQTKDQSLILTENLGRSPGANIDIAVRQIQATDGGEILSTTYQGGRGGNITINATESIQLEGVSPFDGTRFSGIGAPSLQGGGKGGDILIQTQDLLAKNGAGVISRVLGGQGSGSIQIQAEIISLIGENPVISGNASIISSTFAGGDAGPITIDVGRIFLKASGAISASTSGSGNAGSLTINARESIEIDGSGVTLALPSRISASAQQMPARFRQIFGLATLPTGDAGDLVINAPTIKVRNEGYIAAENVGSGDAGSLTINANFIQLQNKGQIRTSTASGAGGILKLDTRNLLSLRNNSLISAKAGKQGNGGNIDINSPVIVGLENSDIIANSVKGKGGNINIKTQGIMSL